MSPIRRLLIRDLNNPEVRILALALLVAVAAVSAVDLFASRIHLAMERQATELLAADLVVDSTRDLPAAWSDEAKKRGLDSAVTQTFPSVVFHGDKSQLVQVKAVSDGYPLRGSLRTANRFDAPDQISNQGPDRGSSWAEPRVFHSLGLTPGGLLELGDHKLKLEQIIRFEPDRGADLFQVAPRLMIAQEDVAATGLVGPHSRIRYRLLFAGDRDAIQDFQTWLKPQLDRRDRIRGIDDGRPEFRDAQLRAERFLGLAAMTTVLLAGAAVGLGAYRYRQRQSEGVALLRTLGATRNTILGLHLSRLLWIALLTGGVGTAIGYAVHAALVTVLAGLFSGELPPPSLLAALSGPAVAFITLAGFALPQILGLMSVAPMQVLRSAPQPISPWSLMSVLAAFGCFLILLRWQAGEWALATYVLIGTLGALAIAALSAHLLTSLTIRLRRLIPAGNAGGVFWTLRFGLGNLERHRSLNTLLLSAFTVGLCVLMILAVVRVDLLNAWQQRLQDGTPNTFLINVQQGEEKPLQHWLTERGLDNMQFAPMVRARLYQVNGETIDPEQYESLRARRFANRAWNLSTRESLPATNQLMEGQWFQDDDIQEWSVESRLADTMGWSLGDELSFAVDGRDLTGRLTSLRKVSWDSFQVNFFVLAEPGLMQGQAASYVTSFHLPNKDQQTLPALNQAFPTVTAIDIQAILGQVKSLIERAVAAIETVFLFTLAAAITILLAGFETTAASRAREIGLLRTLGAGSRQVLWGALVEYVVLGLLCGFIATAIAVGTGTLLAEQILGLAYNPGAQPWLLGLGAGLLLLILAAVIPLRRLLKTRPMIVLREAER